MLYTHSKLEIGWKWKVITNMIDILKQNKVELRIRKTNTTYIDIILINNIKYNFCCKQKHKYI